MWLHFLIFNQAAEMAQNYSLTGMRAFGNYSTELKVSKALNKEEGH